jgi:hypothetical protein
MGVIRWCKSRWRFEQLEIRVPEDIDNNCEGARSFSFAKSKRRDLGMDDN